MSKPRIRLHCVPHRGIYLRWWAEVENMTTGRGTLPYVLHVVESWLRSRSAASDPMQPVSNRGLPYGEPT